MSPPCADPLDPCAHTSTHPPTQADETLLKTLVEKPQGHYRKAVREYLSPLTSWGTVAFQLLSVVY